MHEITGATKRSDGSASRADCRACACDLYSPCRLITGKGPTMICLGFLRRRCWFATTLMMLSASWGCHSRAPAETSASGGWVPTTERLTSSDSASAARVAGCYIMTFGPWSGDSTQLHARHPREIELSSQRTVIYAGGGIYREFYVVRPELPPTWYNLTIWRPVGASADSVVIRSPGRVSGYRLRLNREGERLSGVATYYFDIGPRSASAPVVLERSQCTV